MALGKVLLRSPSDQYLRGRLWCKKALLVPPRRSVLATQANTLSGWHDSVRLAKVREGTGRGAGGGRYYGTLAGDI